MVMTAIEMIDKSAPITEIIRLITSGKELWKSIRNDCEINEDYDLLKAYCESYDCSIKHLTKTATNHIKDIKKIAEHMNKEKGKTPDSQFAIGYDLGHVATIVLGLKDKAPEPLVKEMLAN